MQGFPSVFRAASHRGSLGLLSGLVLGLVACTNTRQSPYVHGDIEVVESGGVSFERLAITNGMHGPAFATIQDLNGDGKVDIALNMFGKIDGFQVPDGEILLFERGEDWTDWSHSYLLENGDGYKWPNGSEAHDIDGDGDLDLAVGGGFLTCQLFPWTPSCGSVFWLEQTGDEWKIHDIVAPGADVFFHHPLFLDVDLDGIEDVIAIGESFAGPMGTTAESEVRLYKGIDGKGGFSSEFEVIGEGLGSLPQLWDVDQDGDQDVVSAEYFIEAKEGWDGASFVWLENPGSEDGTWQRHIIDDSIGPAIQFLMVDNAFGDGVARGFGTNHTNTSKTNPDPEASQLVVYTPTDDATAPWAKEVIADDFVSIDDPLAHAPGIFGPGDIDGDGDIDLLVSGDGDPEIRWYEQQEPGVFVGHVLEMDLTQGGVMTVADLDEDGANEIIISGYDDNVLFVYRRLEEQ